MCAPALEFLAISVRFPRGFGGTGTRCLAGDRPWTSRTGRARIADYFGCRQNRRGAVAPRRCSGSAQPLRQTACLVAIEGQVWLPITAYRLYEPEALSADFLNSMAYKLRACVKSAIKR